MEIKYEYVKTDREIAKGLEKLVNKPLIALDTETTGLDPHRDKLLLIQLSDGQNTYVIDMEVYNSLSAKRKATKVWRLITDIFTNSSTKIGHHIGFDWKMIKAHFDVELTNMFDTMLAERVLTSGKQVQQKIPALKNIVPKYTDLTEKDMNKEIRAGFYAGYKTEGFSKDQLDYSARDILVLHPIYWKQLLQLQEENLIDTAVLEFQVIPVSMSMEYMGVPLDTDVWEKAIHDIEQDKIQKRRQIEHEFKRHGLEKQQSLFTDFSSISLDSPDQLLYALKSMGIPLTDSTSKAALDRLKNDYPLLKDILDYRAAQKLVTSYGDNLLEQINPVTGRIHGRFMQLGTDTGRYSSRNPNLQQIPSDDKCVLRDCFVAPEGYVVLGADYSQQELRVLAALSNEKRMLDAYWKGQDLHSWTTALLFKRDLDELVRLLKSRDQKIDQQRADEITEAEKEAKRQRGIAKSINFLIAYGGTYVRLAAAAGVTEDFAREVMEEHGKVFPALKGFIEQEGNKSIDNLYSSTLLGRKRYYWLPEPGDESFKSATASIKRQGVNHVIQGTSADITKYAAVLVHNRFTERFGRDNAYLWAIIHDEIQTMVREEHLEEASQILTDSMKEAYYRFVPEDICPMKVDAQYGKHWVH